MTLKCCRIDGPSAPKNVCDHDENGEDPAGRGYFLVARKKQRFKSSFSGRPATLNAIKSS